MGRQIHLTIARKISRQPWDPEQALQRALEERAQFLDTYPQYRNFQKEIDRMLDKAGNTENRMNVIALLIESKLVELYTQLKNLNTILRRVSQA